MLDIAFADWLNLGFRWLHVIAGISWIGTSFYFIFLDLSLRKHANLPDGVGGESWNVHGGGAPVPFGIHLFQGVLYTWSSLMLTSLGRS